MKVCAVRSSVAEGRAAGSLSKHASSIACSSGSIVLGSIGGGPSLSYTLRNNALRSRHFDDEEVPRQRREGSGCTYYGLAREQAAQGGSPVAMSSATPPSAQMSLLRPTFSCSICSGAMK